MNRKSSLCNRIIFLLVLVLLASGCAKAKDGTPAISSAGSAAEGEAAGGEEIASAPLEEVDLKENTGASGAGEGSGASGASEQGGISLCFAGDICFADDYIPMQHYREIGATSMADVIDPAYIELMQGADLMWINNEFCYSDRGEPLEGKAYTFRSAPENAKFLQELGVDVAGLANNHVFDYGEDALIDTFASLSEVGIPYVGAGRNIAEAASPVYASVGSLTIGYVAASRAEKYQIVTREATESEAGILRCYENDRFIASIREAAEHADYVIALPHWGTEHSTDLEDVQIDGAHAYIDAGADAVIGAHPHILQGMEYYRGKPIIYSLGNFWFDDYDLYTMIAELKIGDASSGGGADADGGDEDEGLRVELILHPGHQTGVQTYPAKTPEDKTEILQYLESISVNVSIDGDGKVTEQ